MGEFDSFLVRTEVGNSRKLRRFTPEQRWCVIAGVWALAAKSPVRGYLLIAENVPVEVDDVAEQAGVKPAVARATLEKLRDLGMLEADEDLAAEHVHDWHVVQREPKPSESRDAWRERKRRQRERPAPSPTGVPRDEGVTIPPRREEKRSKDKFPPPPRGGRQRDRDRFVQEATAWAEREFPDVPVESVIGYAKGELAANPQATDDQLRAAVRRWTGIAHAAA